MLIYKKKNVLDTSSKHSAYIITDQSNKKLSIADIERVNQFVPDNQVRKLSSPLQRISNIETQISIKDQNAESNKLLPNSKPVTTRQNTSQSVQTPISYKYIGVNKQPSNEKMNPSEKTQPEYTPNDHISIDKLIDQNKLIVETQKEKQQFLFYDHNKNFIGGFTATEFIKYIISHISLNFLPETNCESSKHIIEKYICKISKNVLSKKTTIDMIDHIDSPFMGNIESLIKLYTYIHDFESNRLILELESISDDEQLMVKDLFELLIYSLLNHTLNIISILVNKLDLSRSGSTDIKKTLLNYSVAIVYRLSKFIKDKTQRKIDEVDMIEKDILRIDGIRTMITSKIDTLQNSVDKNCLEIEILMKSCVFRQTDSVITESNNMISTENDDTENDDTENNNTENDDTENDDTENDDTENDDTENDKNNNNNNTEDESGIYNDLSESGYKTLLDHATASRHIDENIRVNNVLNTLSRLSESSKTENKQSYVSASKPIYDTPKTHNISIEHANTLSDIISMHTRVKYETEHNTFGPTDNSSYGHVVRHFSSPADIRSDRSISVKK
jgi:hypothetical protein